mmetsp:Transcript_88392/g.249059  ORF Transcript_88392/g.249059 Transcript_88392/m.249059 type:complete len:374 (+) Transcript_88392:84-1205(+)
MDRGMGRCDVCGNDVALANLALHRLRCLGAQASAAAYTPPPAPTAPSWADGSLGAADASSGGRNGCDQLLARGLTWACPACTLDNAAEAPACDACGQPRDVMAHGAAAATSAVPAARPSTWYCSRCTCENAPGDDRCAACMTARSTAERASARPAGTPTTAARREDAFPASVGGVEGVPAGFGAMAGALGGALLGGVLTDVSGAGPRRRRVPQVRVGATPGAPMAGAAVGAILGGLLGHAAEAELGSIARDVRARRPQPQPSRGLEVHDGDMRWGWMQSQIAMLQQLHGDAAPATHPAAGGAIQALPIHVVTQAEVAAGVPEEHRSCTICMEDFQAGDQQRTLPCFHRFHVNCIDRWLTRQGECPMCKHRIDS